MFDWHRLHLSEATTSGVVDSRRRLRICLGGFVVLLLVVFGRAVQLELSQGAAFRAEATRPLKRTTSLPGIRGRILARDGTVLAYDKRVLALAVHYRYLQQPPDPRWLRFAARARLSPAQREDPQRVAAEQSRVNAQRAQLRRRLARLCNLSAQQWSGRARRIQARVERIAASVNRRRAGTSSPDGPPWSPARPSGGGSGWPCDLGLPGRIGRVLRQALRASLDDPPSAPVIVAEQLDYHVVAEGLPLAVVAEIEGHPGRYPGVKIIQRTRRAYPSVRLAAHVLGHLAPVAKKELRPGGEDRYHPDDFVGRMGLERQYESLLRGRRGAAVELTDHTGRVVSCYREREPGVGRDLVLTLDPQLQRTAEALLDSALERRLIRPQPAAHSEAHGTCPSEAKAGGAVVVMDVRSGAIRAAASAPRFDPNRFVRGRPSELASLLRAPGHPLFDRATKMALAPGSLFKIVSAAALLEASAVDPDEPFFCRGYLRRPDRKRCAIYRRRGIGHGELALGDALARSCNVYFFHHAGQLGAGPLVDWARRFGFGRPTGVDLPDEAAGVLPRSGSIPGRQDRTHLLAIGQGPLTVTPLQVVRMMAAVANGGQLVTPHVVSRLGLPELAEDESPSQIPTDPIRVPPPRPIAGLKKDTLAVLRQGLERGVADRRGTAHGTVYLDSVAIAGKTGTAETGGGRAEHAWFAGYVPADTPKLAFVVVLEHAGDGATAAGPVAKRLAIRMRQLGMF